MKLLLTSTGFDNQNLLPYLHNLLDKSAEEAKALFIPTALNTPDSRKYVYVFLEDLLKAGVKNENIYEYDLKEPFGQSNILSYDIIFFCPGSPEHLLSRIKAVSFQKTLEVFLEKGGVYVGVSAGSDVAAKNFPDGLGYLDARLETHAKEGTPNGSVDITITDVIKITDNQAVLINSKDISVIE